MEKTDNQMVEAIRADFEVLWCGKVQQLVGLRRTKMSQTSIAVLTGRSLKTIQRFENYSCKDPELLYIYKEVLIS